MGGKKETLEIKKQGRWKGARKEKKTNKNIRISKKKLHFTCVNLMRQKRLGVYFFLIKNYSKALSAGILW